MARRSVPGSAIRGRFLSGFAGSMKPMEILRLQPAGLVVSPAFSHVAVVPAGAATVYVGGQNGVDETGTLVSEELAAQSARALANAEVALAAGGAMLSDVVQWTVLFVEGVDLSAACSAPPLVVGARVAALGVPGALLEVSAIAAVLPRSDALDSAG
jgi:enamine deaminase RidA (YjgF/YER057c/UK114 family)